MIWSYLSLLAAILLGVGGQIFLKSGARHDGIVAQYLAPQSLLGLGLYFAAAVLYMFALRKIAVSVAFPAVSLSYVVVVGVAYWRYGESVTWSRFAGVLFICSGVFLVARHA